MNKKIKIEIIVEDSNSLWTIYCSDFQPLHNGFHDLDSSKFDDYFKKYDKIKIIMDDEGFKMYGLKNEFSYDHILTMH